MSLNAEIIKIAGDAKKASYFLSTVSSSQKNKALKMMADGLLKSKSAILNANKKDIAAAGKQNKKAAFIDRLALSDDRIKKMSNDLKSIVALDDPVGKSIKSWTRPNGLLINKVRVPLGVVGIIYESRPNVTSDCAGLCLKSGNAVILRGGKESINSNKAIYEILSQALTKCGFPKGCINLIRTVEREAVSIILGLSEYIDLVIPRGGESLIREVVEKSRIPVIKHYKGICHTYVDKYADLKIAEEVCFNAKVQRPSTCNAMECLLVHKKIAKKFIPVIVARLKNSGVEIRGCLRSRNISPEIKKASKQDYATEFLDLILSLKVVDNMAEAIEHILTFGSKHSDAIITENFKRGLRFMKSVDSACVYLNASTRFTDGNQFGLGAEIGVSTDKLHARGPMGLEELTTYKFMVMGNGQIRTN